MVPPDPDRSKRLPTLSWESVVDDAPDGPAAPDVPRHQPEPVPAVAAAPIAPLVPPAPPALDELGDAVTSPAPTPLTFAPMTLNAGRVEPIELITDPLIDPLVDAEASDPIVDAEASASAPLSSTLPSQVIPAIGDIETGPADVGPASDELPIIREATPVPDQSSALTDIGGESALAFSGPRLPRETQPDQRSVAAPVFVAEAAAPTTTPKRKHGKRRGSRRGLRLVLTLVLLGGLVAAAIVFGRPYLFPSEWDEASAPYAEAVEEARGSEFAEPITVNKVPSADFSNRFASELVAPWVDAQPQWRALGLTSGVLAETSVAQQLSGWRAAMYSLEDGQVYGNADTPAATLDGQLTQATVATSLDQEFGWSGEQSARALDDQAATSAEVLRQVRAIQEESSFGVPVEPVSPSLVDGLPTLLGYQLLGPHVYSEFTVASPDATTHCTVSVTSDPSLFAAAPVVASQPQVVAPDTPTTSAAPMDRSFWYLAFAGFLDASTAHAASEAIVENSLMMADRNGTACVYATFSGGGVDATSIVRSALERWSAAAPVEFASSFSVLGDGSLQLVSCDPGLSFQSPVRPGLARELVSWRVAELATIDAVRIGGSTNLAADFAGAWPYVVNSNAVAALIAMPSDTTPEALADAARAQVASVFTPAG